MGPAVGGFLIDTLGWRAAFWANLPLAVVVVWLALRHVPESRSGDASGRLDWAGAALAVIAAGLLSLGLTALAVDGGGWTAAILSLLGVAAAVGFVAVERRAAAPLVPPALFASRAFVGANLTTLFLYGALAGMLFLLPFELMGPRGMDASEVGLALLPLGLIIGLFARRAGALADTVGPRVLLAAGSTAAAVAGCLFAAGLPGLAGVLAPVILLAAGMTLVVAPLTTAVMNAAPDALAGAASGVNNAASRIAGLFAVALVGAVAARVFAASPGTAGAAFGVWPGGAAEGQAAAAFASAYGVGMVVAAGLAALGAVAAWVSLAPGTRSGIA